MYFEKYHGTGNDFIIFTENLKNPEVVAKKVCDRHFGIGADGIMFPTASKRADIFMHYYNSDGSMAKMCGNGIRCFSRFVFDHGLVTSPEFVVETKAGLYEIKVDEKDVTVNLSYAVFKLDTPDVSSEIADFKPHILSIDNQEITVFILELGTLHTVLFLNDYPDIDKNQIGPKILNHALFLNQTNLNFVEVVSPNQLKVETLERGAGWTLSCGTGVGAASLVSNLLKRTQSKMKVVVPGGNLHVEIKVKEVILKGPAVRIAKGVFEYE